MLREFGLSETEPGLEITETFIEEDLRYNPECPCPTRTCPQHGFCKICVQHHRELAEMGQVEAFDPDAEPEDGSYPMDHSRPLCKRIPREWIPEVRG